MSVVAWIVLGLGGGAIVGFLTGARGRELVASVVVGILGAVLGGFIAAVVLGLDISGVDGTSLLVAGFAALALILFQRAIPSAEVYD